MKTTVKADYMKIPAGTEVTLRVLVAMEAPEAEGTAKARPLNLVLVLDRSGSMSGPKLRNVRQAAGMLFERLAAEDIFSLVAYDSEVDDIVPPVRVGEAVGVAERIAAVRSRGCTFLSGGYERGCALAGRAGSGEFTSRVILLSDGLANEGETRPKALAQIAAGMLAEGITTTTIGVGEGYNEGLMALMAEYGGGGAHFIERPEDAVSVFEEELGCLKSLAASRVEVSFKAAGTVSAHEQLNSFRVSPRGRFLVGDAYAGQRKSLVLELRVKADAPGQVELGTVVVRWQPAAGAADEVRKASFPVRIEAVAAEFFEASPADREVTLEAAHLVAARAKRKAIELADLNKFEDAAGLLEACAGGLKALELGDPRLDEEISELFDRARRLRTEREEYYNVMERKRLYHEYDKGSKSNFASMAMMKARTRPQARPGQVRRAVYACVMHDRHPVVETSQGPVLIDTGASASFGRGPTVSLGGRDFRLARDYFGQSIEEIGRLVGGNFYALLGADILGSFDWELDLEQGSFTVGAAAGQSDIVLPFTDFMGVPIIEARVDGQRVRLFLDTCAKVSYLEPALLDGRPTAGEQTDFFPGFGAFTTTVSRLPVKLSMSTLEVDFGRLPQMLGMALGMANVNGILGAALLNDFRLHFAASLREIRMERLCDTICR